MLKISIVAGARPNFIKIAPIIEAIKQKKALGEKISYRLVHTGQHYDEKMSGQFFIDLQITKPDVNLNCGGGSQAEQTAEIMKAFEKELIQNPADLVIVVGDVNSTMACSITAKKLHTKVAHVEAGIRSFDMKMPEEINRIVTDSLSDYFFTTSRSANKNLRQMGKTDDQIFFVGNVMIDSLFKFIPAFKKPEVFDQHNLSPQKYFILTLHRPSNVDEITELHQLIQFLCEQVENIPIIFPVHPRTQKNLNLKNIPEKLILTPPLGYLEFNYLVKNALGVLTDSGGITEETSMMNIPCLTLRDSTERPETITHGTNELVGKDRDKIALNLKKILNKNWKQGVAPELWDGKSAERIVEILLKLYKN